MEESNFGFKKYSKKEHSSKVKDVFNKVANKYDLMNDIMSLGMQRLWKREFIEYIDPKKNENLNFVDLAGGTGDIGRRILLKFKKNISVNIIDINKEMLSEGQNSSDYNNLSFICSSGEEISIDDNYADVVTISFGIRNMSDRDKCLEECYRILKPGGIFVCMEFSLPKDIVLRNFYDAWSYGVIPKIGKLVVGDEKPYQYLVDSIRTFPSNEEFNEMIVKAGFKNTSIRQLTGNIVCIYRGEKI
ncbi:MAG: class I SAM-dependent methyltransferase [Rhizobiales bacterium TMED168]|nr:MAG: class I SAM-dependent methyltransferase [Rhizobiales bacterium TMED168]|tara:strand:- start:77937 stop:78671 length:735 start_codon:yes stop_codon:yes gene_type:complete